MPETQDSVTISTKLEQIAMLAKRSPKMAFTSLAHHIDLEWLREAYRRTRKDGATGIDGQDADEYAIHLENNLRSLLERAKSGAYRAPPVRRVHIPKGTGGETRPIGIPTFEDKVLQRAVAMLLSAIYEQDFNDCSYGFRPKRSAHQALNELRNAAMTMKVGWVLEADIRKFFDTLDHTHLMTILRRRVRDGVLLRLIGKWLKAGILEDGELSLPDAGSPQGGVISPLLANIYLHEVLDEWFESVVKQRLQGRVLLVRYCDDFVLLFSRQNDARRVLEVLPKRFGKYGLTLHPDKTRLLNFRRPVLRPRVGGRAKPGTFSFLGFSHLWTKSRQGNWVIKQRTACDRFTRALIRVTQWCRENRHQPVRWQWQVLTQKLRGHFGYFGITGNYEAILRFYREVRRVWRKWLNRRSQRARMRWDRMEALLERYPLPEARIMRHFHTSA